MWIQNLFLTSLDGYPYHIMPYGGAKGLGGTPGKNHTSKVVIDLIVETKNFKPNLDNCLSSMKLLRLLNSLEMLM